MLALAVVAKAKVGKPNLLESLEGVFANGKNFLMYDPVYHISAWRVCERSLVVIEGIHLIGRRLNKLLPLIRQLFFDTSNLGRCQCVEEISEVNLLNQAEIKWAEFLNEGVAVFGFLE